MLTAILLWLLVLGVLLFVHYARHVEPRRLNVTHLRLSFPDLPETLEGLKLVQLSDLHVHDSHDSFGAQMARQAVALAAECQPDLVCVTGDLAQSSRAVHVAAEILQPLACHPLFVVMGNHDHDKMLEADLGLLRGERLDAEQWRAVVVGSGAQVLQNEAARLAVHGGMVVVAGVGDPSCGWDDLPRALADDPSGDFHLLLVHSPDMIDDPRTEWADLVLCGHTHGGQIRLPGLGTPWAPVWHDRRRASGLMRFGSTLLYVNRGVAAGVRWRFLCPPEIVSITLTRGEGDAPRLMERSPAHHRTLQHNPA